MAGLGLNPRIDGASACAPSIIKSSTSSAKQRLNGAIRLTLAPWLRPSHASLPIGTGWALRPAADNRTVDLALPSRPGNG